MKLLVCEREEALSIGKDKFIDNGVLHLVYVKESNENALKDIKYFLSEKDFKIISIEELKSIEKEKKYVVNLENRYLNQRKLGQLQEKYPNVRFTGSGLMNQDCVKLGVLPKEELESRLSCRVKDKKPFVYNEILEITPFVEGLEYNDFCKDDIEEDFVKFTSAKRKKVSGKAKSRFGKTFKKKKKLFKDEGIAF